MSDQYKIEQHFRLWYKPLCLYALNYLNNLEESEDVVQDVFYTLWNRSESGNLDVSSIKSYLFTSVRNRCLDLLKSSSHKTAKEDLERAESIEVEEDSVMQNRAVQQAQMWTAIDSLPKQCRKILLMSKVDGMKYSEIANELGISENTVRNQMAKALSNLRTRVKKVVTLLMSL